jgi:tetratricopeptide (TPR) repeat protein
MYVSQPPEYRYKTAQSSGKPKEAEEIWRKILQNDPNNAYAHYKLCDVLDDQNRIAEAESACRSAVQIDSSNGEYWFLWGYSIFKRDVNATDTKTRTSKGLTGTLSMTHL